MSGSTNVNSASTTFRFSDLPEDIGRLIFEIVADNGWGPACALVSKKVQAW
jgi:Fe-S cluster biosynthesis and repair protein YggX